MDGYRSLIAWQRSHTICIQTLRLCDDEWSPRGGALLAQPRRAVISIEANIVEGYALGTPGLFTKHLRYSMGSAAESEILLQNGVELDYLSAPRVRPTISLMPECMMTMRGLLRKYGQ